MPNFSMQPPIVGNRPSASKRQLPKMNKPLLVLAFVLVAFFAYTVVAKAAYPILLIHSENVEIANLKKQLEAEDARNKEMKARIQFLKTAEGAQTEARRLGWVKKGEVAFQLKQTPKPAEQNSTHGIGGAVRNLFKKH